MKKEEQSTLPPIHTSPLVPPLPFIHNRCILLIRQNNNRPTNGYQPNLTPHCENCIPNSHFTTCQGLHGVVLRCMMLLGKYDLETGSGTGSYQRLGDSKPQVI
ncbi:hypothetical protein WUBG_05570 [Wuchereria bancrofti]|uniref:Uncharacterized protein n=1 Tax=Wuchereria bancrofti TaxID=6293 RepID=J9B8W0_WUCBA|nr:hypothetical protein WUBG_05570 [Wuchereria bancrofti]